MDWISIFIIFYSKPQRMSTTIFKGFSIIINEFHIYYIRLIPAPPIPTNRFIGIVEPFLKDDIIILPIGIALFLKR